MMTFREATFIWSDRGNINAGRGRAPSASSRRRPCRSRTRTELLSVTKGVHPRLGSGESPPPIRRRQTEEA
jgi:hypothetical protein